MIKKLYSSPKREPLSRLWFLARGFKQVPLDLIGGKVLWAHKDGYFLNAYGQKVKHNFSSAMQTSDYTHGGAYPNLRQFCCKNCHVLMCTTSVSSVWTKKKGNKSIRRSRSLSFRKKAIKEKNQKKIKKKKSDRPVYSVAVTNACVTREAQSVGRSD